MELGSLTGVVFTKDEEIKDQPKNRIKQTIFHVTLKLSLAVLSIVTF